MMPLVGSVGGTLSVIFIRKVLKEHLNSLISTLVFLKHGKKYKKLKQTKGKV